MPAGLVDPGSPDEAKRNPETTSRTAWVGRSRIPLRSMRATGVKFERRKGARCGCEPHLGVCASHALRTLARRPRAPCDRDTRLAALHCGCSDSIDPLVAVVARVRVTSPPAGAAPASALWLVSRKTPQIEGGRLSLEQSGNAVKEKR